MTFSGSSASAVDIDNTANFNGTMLANATINAALFDNVAYVWNAGGGLGGVLTVTNGDKGSIYGVKADTSNGAGISVGIRTSQLGGTADEVKFDVRGVGAVIAGAVGTAPTINTAALTSSTTGVEKISVATSGTNVFSITGSTTAATDGATVEITGNGSNTITASAMTQASLYDMSTSTGTNTLRLDGALTTSDTVKGGTGTDTLRIVNNTTAANLTVTGVETLRMATGSPTGTLVFASAPNFTTLRVDGDTAESGTNTLTGIGNTALTVSYVGDSLSVNAASAQQFNNLTVNNSYAGTETVAVNIGNGGATTSGGYTLNTLTLNGAENINITASDMSAAAQATFTGIVSTALSTIKVTAAAGGVVLGNVNGVTASSTSGNLLSLDFSAVTGTALSSAVLLTNTVGAGTVILGATGTGGTTITLGAETGTDSVTYTGGAGVDTVDGLTNTFAGTMVVSGLAGNDVLSGGSNADSLTGGEGQDTITGGAGADSIVLTETVSVRDTVVYTAITQGSAAGATLTGADTITGFVGGTDRVSVLGNAASVVLNAAGAAQASGTAFTATASGAFNANGAVGGAFITGATAADLTSHANVGTAIGAVANETVGESAYFVVTNTAGTQFGIYHFVAATADNAVTASTELKLLGIGTFTGTLAAGDFIFT